MPTPLSERLIGKEMDIRIAPKNHCYLQVKGGKKLQQLQPNAGITLITTNGEKTRHYRPPDVMQHDVHNTTHEGFLSKIFSLNLLNILDLVSTF